MNDRRRFLCCAVACILVYPLRASAQAKDKIYRIGYLNPRAGPGAFDDAFVRGMRERGYAIGRNLVIEYRWAGNDMQRLQPLADETRDGVRHAACGIRNDQPDALARIGRLAPRRPRREQDDQECGNNDRRGVDFSEHPLPPCVALAIFIQPERH